jgi:hypothetical protein
VVNGVCVPDTNECNGNPCYPGATCNDPTPNSTPSGDYVCTCPGGTTGNGRGPSGCADINECSGANPCGVGTCVNATPPPNRYTCTCPAGYASITPAGATGPTCVCDLSGTFASVIDTAFTYPPIFNEDGTILVIEGSPTTGVVVRSWAIRHHTVSSNGTITVRTSPCGGVSPTLCDRALSAAHAQFQSNQIWGRPRINAGFPIITHSLTGVVPGGQYLEPESVALQGITLQNPAGAWPPCRQCVGLALNAPCTCPGRPPTVPPFTVTVTNPATWVDTDGDGPLGMTTNDVSRGGELINGDDPDPPIDYPQPSECPRLTTPQGTYNYTEWPGLTAAGAFFRAHRWYAASRAISSMRGTTITFDAPTNRCVIAGTVGGPAAGNKPKTDARFHDCDLCQASDPFGCTPAGAGSCQDAHIDSYDSVEQTQQVYSSNFTIRKIPAVDITSVLALDDSNPAKATQLGQICAEVRVANCPTGKSCN